MGGLRVSSTGWVGLHTAWPLLPTLLYCAAAAAAPDAPPAAAGRRRLFFDDSLLDTAATTATRTVHTIDGGDDPTIILRPDSQWELGKSLDHASVLYDPADAKFKLYYSLATDCGVTCDQKTDEEDGMLGYAESTDGTHFHKPLLGFLNATNLLGPNVAGPSVFLNTAPAATADQRFVSV
eukprot:SAG22_NODE_8024_length_690_cov_0.773266_1_plen_179_part_01